MQLFATTLLLALPCGSLAFAQEGEAPAADAGPLIVFHCAGAEKLFVDEKDRGLFEALSRVDDRVAELPEELGGDFVLPPGALPLAARLFRGPLSLRAGMAADSQGGFPVYAQLDLGAASAEDAAAITEQVKGLLAMMGMDVLPAEDSGLHPLPIPLPAWYGPVGDGFLVAVGEIQDAPLSVEGIGLPDGVEAALAVRLDLGGLFALAEQLGAGASAEFTQVYELCEMIGLADADLRWSMGSDAERTYSAFVMPGYGPVLQELGLLPAAPISQRSLAAVPVDALWASLATNNLQGTLGFLKEVMAQPLSELGVEDPFEQLAEATGIDLERDLLAHLGTSLGVYASDTTGGGGLLSLVLFAELGDAQALSGTAGRIEELLNGLAQAEAEGYVQIRRWDHGEAHYASLNFPGLPVPFEPTWSIASGFFVLGATPQAALGAVHQLRPGAQNLTHNPRFAGQLAAGTEGLYGLAFLDVPRLLPHGYGLTSLACSALDNATRSRTDPERGAGHVLPMYHDLAAGAKACVITTRVVAGDVIEEARMDRSILVNGTALMGVVGPAMVVLAPAALGVVAQKTVQGAEAQLLEFEPVPAPAGPADVAEADILSLHYAAAEFAVFNGGNYPDSLELLVVPDVNGFTYLGREELPADPWGNPYGYEPPAGQDEIPRIFTLGADGAAGGEGPDADLDNKTILQRMGGGR